MDIEDAATEANENALININYLKLVKKIRGINLINKIIEFITERPAMTAIGWLATMIGLILAIVIPIVTRRKKKISYSYTTTQLVEAEVAKAKYIEVLFNKQSIERLSVTKFLIKNSGNTVIKSDDMYEGHELKIIGARVKIISVDVESVSRDIVTEKKELESIYHSKDTIRRNDKDLKIVNLDDEYGLIPVRFKVFEKKDYMRLNIYHTGGKDTKFEMVGIGEDLKIVDETAAFMALEESLMPASSLSLYDLQKLIIRTIFRI